MTTWSRTGMPMRSPTLAMRRVSATSSGLGLGSPEGWLCNRMVLDAASIIKGRNTALGSTKHSFEAPLATTISRIASFLELSPTTTKTSCLSSPSLVPNASKISALQPKQRGFFFCPLRSTTRMPSSNAATTLEALASPIPGKRPSAVRSCLKSPSNPSSSKRSRRATSTTFLFPAPVPMSRARISESLSATGPLIRNRSRGFSWSGHWVRATMP